MADPQHASELLGEVGHVVVPVDDLDAAVGFCQRAYGLELAFKDGEDYALLECDHLKLGLATADQHPPGAGVAFSFKVPDIEAATERVLAEGASVVADRVDSEHEKRQLFADPSGNAFYVYEPL